MIDRLLVVRGVSSWLLVVRVSLLVGALVVGASLLTPEQTTNNKPLTTNY